MANNNATIGSDGKVVKSDYVIDVNDTLSALNGPPIHQYLFTESSFGTAQDSGRIGDYAISPTGGTPTTTAGPTGFGSELAIQGISGAYLSNVSAFPLRFDRDFTFAAYCSLSASGTTTPYLVNHNNGGSDQSIYLFVTRSTGAITFHLSADGTVLQTNTTANSVFPTDDSWVWVWAGFEYSTGNMLVRVDDGIGNNLNVIAKAALQNVGIYQLSHPMEILGNSGGDDWDGKCAAFYMFDRYLSTSEMDAIYASGSATVENLTAASEDGAVLAYNKGQDQYENRKLFLDHLGDVDATNPSDKQIMQYGSASSTFAPIDHTINNLSDVDTASIAQDDTLQYSAVDQTFKKGVTLTTTTAAPLSARGPVNQWLFNDASTSSIADTGTIGDYPLDSNTGDPSLTSGPSGFGKGNAVDVDENDTLEGSSNFPQRLDGDWSFAAYASLRSAGQNLAVLAIQAQTGSDFTFYASVDRSTGVFQTTVYNAAQSTRQASTASSEFPSDETWHWAFVTYVKSTGTVKVRVDSNTSVTASYGVDTQVFQHSKPLNIGGWTDALTTNDWNGKIAGAYFFDRELSEAEMDAIYASGSATIENLALKSLAGTPISISNEGSFEGREFNLRDVFDVDADAPADADSLKWDDATQTWKNSPFQPDAHLELNDTATPALPAAGEGSLWKEAGNDGLLWAADGDSEVTDLTRPRLDADAITNITTDLVLSASPINQWKLNESDIGTNGAVDTGSNSDYNLDTVTNTVSTVNGFPEFGEGKAAGFSSSTLKGSAAYPNRFTADFSIVALIRRSDSTDGVLVDVSDSAPSPSVFLWITGDKLRATVYESGGGTVSSTTTTTITDTTQWHWCFLTYVKAPSGTLTVRLDSGGAGDVATGTFGSDTQIRQHATSPLMIGSWNPATQPDSGNDFEGSIDAVYVFDYALSTDEMDSIYASGMQNTEDFLKSSTSALKDGDIVQYEASTSTFKRVNLGLKQATATTTDATVTTLASINIPTDSVNLIEARVVAKNGTTETNAYKVFAHVDDVSGTPNAVNVTKDYESEEQANWDVTVDTSGTTARIRITGEAAKTVSWAASYTVETLE